MRKRYAAAAGVAVLLLLGRAYLSTGGSTPAQQPPLADVSDLGAFEAEFSRETASLRVIVLLSPSCPYCLKGAAEVERILRRHPGRPLVIFAVWQPILPTDWGKPGTGSLRRLSDPRVRQFWDAGHRVAAALEHSSRGRDLQPSCCFNKGVWWDLMAVFPPGTEWRETLPAPILLDGTVAEAAPAFEALLDR